MKGLYTCNLCMVQLSYRNGSSTIWWLWWLTLRLQFHWDFFIMWLHEFTNTGYCVRMCSVLCDYDFHWYLRSMANLPFWHLSDVYLNWLKILNEIAPSFNFWNRRRRAFPAILYLSSLILETSFKVFNGSIDCKRCVVYDPEIIRNLIGAYKTGHNVITTTPSRWKHTSANIQEVSQINELQYSRFI